MIKRLAERYRKFKFNFIFPESIRRFCEINRFRWREFLEEKRFPRGASILVDGMVDHPGYLMNMGIVSNVLKKVKGLNTLWITRGGGYNRKQRCVIDSYGGRTKGIRSYLSPLMLLFSLAEAALIFLRMKKAEDTLRISYRGVFIGDLIYDTYVRDTALGTIKKKDIYLFRKITEALFLYKWYERVIRKNQARYIVVGHVVYNSFGVLCRVGIKHGIVVYTRKGWPHSFTVRKYASPSDIGSYELKIPEELFDDIYGNHLGLAKRNIENYFQERMGAAVHDHDAQSAYGLNKVVYTKAELVELLGIDTEKPLVFVMPHVFPDAPHSNRWCLFKDHYDWAYNTLTHIADVKDINWILKDHPSNRLYNSKEDLKTLCRELFGDGMPEHMVFMPDTISTKTVLDAADGIVTSYGTAGLEASCYGIKCLLAGDAPFSGLGFTFDPKTREEYYRYLSSLFNQENKQKVDTDRAKTAAFIYFKHLLVPFSMVPGMGIMKLDSKNEEEVYGKAERLLQRVSFAGDYGINGLIKYFQDDLVLMTNSFDIYNGGNQGIGDY